jgi:flagellar hook-basal body complex protein FliE
MDIKSAMPALAAIRSGQAAGGAIAGSGLAGAASTSGVSGVAGVKAAPAGGSASFSNVLKNALQSVSESQNEVNTLQRDYQLNKPGVSLEQTMIAMQKAQIEFQAAVTVRNRLVSAYTDIMNMSV